MTEFISAEIPLFCISISDDFSLFGRVITDFVMRVIRNFDRAERGQFFVNSLKDFDFTVREYTIQ